MKRLRWLGILMFVTMLGITGFQIFWLKETYNREAKNLAFKTETAFLNTVHHLQGSKFKLEKIFHDSVPHNKRIFISDYNPEQTSADSVYPRQNIVTTINILQDKVKDSLKAERFKKPGIAVSFDKSSFYYKQDSTEIKIKGSMEKGTKDFMFRFLAGVDSLQDTLKLKEIYAAYSITLKNQKMVVPFTILRLDSAILSPEGPGSNEITLGFAHPVTYKMQLGNTSPYLLKQIASPIIFSIFLVGITVLSFLLLYRNLLRQRRLAVLKNEFISNITHELKTPIATVGVAIEALRNFGVAQSPEKTQEYLDISAAELQRLGLLVDKTLKISMLENGKIELKKESLDIKELVLEVVNIMKLQFEKTRAQVNVKTNGEHFLIEADRLHIISVLYNLLDNVLKYSKENPVIDLQLSSLPNDIIELKVKDNGIGIPKEYQSKVFDKFFRVPAGDTHNVKGYGLGLSYVKEIVSAHMGYITVESELGKGSIFTVKLPFKEAPVIYFDDKIRIFKKSIRL